MRDPRASKNRDLRRNLRSWEGFSPRRRWEKIHGQYVRWRRFHSACDCSSWYECRNKEDEFLRKWTGCEQWELHSCHEAVSASFRRDLNRLQRARERQAIQEAFVNDDWEDFCLPRHRRDAAWLWW